MQFLLGPALQGFLVSGALIVAIGAQNAFVLRQGLRGEHARTVAWFCAVCDALLIAAGVFGASWLGNRLPALESALRWGGALFLLAYGLLALRRAWVGGGGLGAATSSPPQSRPAVLAQAAAFTLLNPHVYLDTLLLVGSLGAALPSDPQRLAFVAGAAAASLGWFQLIGPGAQRMAGALKRPAVWRGLDLAIGLLMLGLAVSLIR